MQITDPEVLNKVANWRRKAVDGTLSLDEMREAVKALRQNRMSAAEAAAKGKSTKAKGPQKSAGDLLSELDGL